jgi:uncharacterized protein
MSMLSTRRAGWVAAAVATVLGIVAVVTGIARPGGPTRVQAATPGTDTITVTGVGTSDATPDTLDVDFTVRVTRASVQEALDAQADAAQRLLAALKASGVERNRTTTTDLMLDRHYDDHGNVTGYDASETIRAKVRPLSRAGRTISRAATSAGNNVSVGNIAFDVADDHDSVSAARSNAYADARDRAEQYASLSGRALGRVEKVSETVDAPQEPVPFYAQDMLRSAVAAPVPLRPGQKTLTVHVTVTWSLA